MTLADLNGDNIPDLVVAKPTTNAVAVFVFGLGADQQNSVNCRIAGLQRCRIEEESGRVGQVGRVWS